MDSMKQVAGFASYLKESNPSIFEVFKDRNSLGWRQDPENPQEYQLMILLSPEYFTEEEGDKLIACWKNYKALPKVN